jgi:serine/threonine-protein kinase
MLSGDDSDIWVYDFRTTVFTRLTFEKRMFGAIWSRNGKQLYYSSGLSDKGGLMSKNADGSTVGTLMLQSSGFEYPTSVDPNDKHLFVDGSHGLTSEGDIYAFNLEGERKLTPLISTPAVEYGGQIAPDGRYLAYMSNETGRLEVYVRTYPDLKGKWQISTNGGLYPIWSPKGNEIFFMSGTGKMMAVPLQKHPSFSPGTPKEFFDAARMYSPNSPLANFDIAPDGTKFLFVRSAHHVTEIVSFNIILNWTSELARVLEEEG